MPERFSVQGRVPAAGAPPCRVLAYGDSLTAGYYDEGDAFAPYGEALAEALAPGAAAEVWVCGLSGLTALQMVKGLSASKIRDAAGRVGRGLLRILQAEGPFDLVLVMAGTNDIGDGSMSPAAIVVSISALHAACHEQGVRTVALSVPPSKFVGLDPEYGDCWAAVNDLLRKWADGPGAEQGAALFVDTGEPLPFARGNGLWDRDGLHLSAVGSRRLGEKLAPQIGRLLRGQQAPAAPPRPRGPRPMPECVSSRAAPGDEAQVPRRRLLAFGDSLTAGYHAFGNLLTPYAEGLGPHLLPHVATDIYVCGFNGLTARSMAEGLGSPELCDVTDRAGPGLRRALEEHGPFDLALIMAGTNDLAKGYKPAAIFEHIKTLHQACHSAGCRTAALAVPPNKAMIWAGKAAGRQQSLNQLLEEWVEAAPRGGGGTAGAVLFADTGALMPYSDGNGLWEADGLHFSRAGSLHLGARLAPALRPALLEAGGGGAASGGSDLHGRAQQA